MNNNEDVCYVKARRFHAVSNFLSDTLCGSCAGRPFIVGNASLCKRLGPCSTYGRKDQRDVYWVETTPGKEHHDPDPV